MPKIRLRSMQGAERDLLRTADRINDLEYLLPHSADLDAASRRLGDAESESLAVFSILPKIIAGGASRLDERSARLPTHDEAMGYCPSTHPASALCLSRQMT